MNKQEWLLWSANIADAIQDKIADIIKDCKINIHGKKDLIYVNAFIKLKKGNEIKGAADNETNND